MKQFFWNMVIVCTDSATVLELLTGPCTPFALRVSSTCHWFAEVLAAVSRLPWHIQRTHKGPGRGTKLLLLLL
jgi:hypothetical protein